MNFDKFRRIIQTLRQHKPDIILLQETAPPSTHPNLSLMQSLWQTIWQGDIYLSPLIAILISPQYKSKLLGISNDNRVMDVSIEHPKHLSFSIRNIYAPAQESLHRSFWASIPPLPHNTMIVGGDFNCILCSINHISSTSYACPTHPDLFQQHFPALVDLASTSSTPKYTCYTHTTNS